MMPQQQSEFYLRGDQCWFVYLFALADCSAFKVGFSCNPFQRIYSFSRRYFERFDLRQSLVLQLDTNADARAIETALKTQLAEFRAECPSWVPQEAGGHTEWFGAVHFGQAEHQLQSYLQLHERAHVIDTSAFIRSEIDRLSLSFEQWAWAQAQYLCDAGLSAGADPASADMARSLRDWLDAYRFFDVQVFQDDPAVMRFVTQCVQAYAPR